MAADAVKEVVVALLPVLLLRMGGVLAIMILLAMARALERTS